MRVSFLMRTRQVIFTRNPGLNLRDSANQAFSAGSITICNLRFDKKFGNF